MEGWKRKHGSYWSSEPILNMLWAISMAQHPPLTYEISERTLFFLTYSSKILPIAMSPTVSCRSTVIQQLDQCWINDTTWSRLEELHNTVRCRVQEDIQNVGEAKPQNKVTRDNTIPLKPKPHLRCCFVSTKNKSTKRYQVFLRPSNRIYHLSSGTHHVRWFYLWHFFLYTS